MKYLLTAAAVMALVAPATAETAAETTAQALTQTYIFGDSSVEQGNLYALPGLARPGTPYFNKDGFSRESNGPVWIEYLRPDIKPVLGSSIRDRDVNFAYSGATSGAGNIAASGRTGLAGQIDAFAARIAAGAAKPGRGDLFVIAAGTNDFIRDLGVVDLRTTSKEVIGNLGTAVTRLSAAGASRVLVEDIPNFILAPEFNDLVPAGERKKLVDQLTEFTRTHNAAQVAALAELNGKLSGTDVVTVKVSKLFDHVRANAGKLGFTVVDKPCYDESTGKLCSTDRAAQNRYLFFDNLHLTTAAQKIQADYYAALIGQLGGSANLVAAGLGRDLAAVERAEAVNERAARRTAWLAAVPPQGITTILDASYARVRDNGPLAASGDRQAWRFGFGYADGDGWSVRLLGGRQIATVDHAQGEYRIRSWSVQAAGERRWGALRIGASVGYLWGNARGDRRIPAALMQTGYRTGVSASHAELEAGLMLEQGGLAFLPSIWTRYERSRFDKFAETGDTGLEMAYPRHNFEALYGGVGGTLAWQVTPTLRPRVALSHERRITDGAVTVTGRLVDNSADPIGLRVAAFTRATSLVEPGVDLSLGRVSLSVSGQARLEAKDLGGRARLTIAL